MIALITLLIGDMLVIALQGFYMGVGIRESAGAANILGMTIPSMLVWLVLAFIIRLYPNGFELNKWSNRPEGEKYALWKDINWYFNRILQIQRIYRLAIVWALTSIFAVLWQTFYWGFILNKARGISIRFTFYYCLFGFVILFIWRVFWGLSLLAFRLAKSHKAAKVFLWTVIVLVILYQVPALYLTIKYAPRKYSKINFTNSPFNAAIVFGAGVYANGVPSSVLVDRVETAVDLYKEEKIDRMILSGDNSEFSRYESNVMAAVANDAGAPDSALLLDNHGLDTSSTCYNARHDFGVIEGVLVTQSYHTTRALYTCDHYGVYGVSVAADRSVYNIFSWLTWSLRDWMGLTLAWFYYDVFNYDGSLRTAFSM